MGPGAGSPRPPANGSAVAARANRGAEAPSGPPDRAARTGRSSARLLRALGSSDRSEGAPASDGAAGAGERIATEVAPERAFRVAGSIEAGAVSIEGGRIAAVDARAPAGAIDLGSVAIMPALVNAHTHLELSYLRGMVPPTRKFLDWIHTIMATRRQYPDAGDPRILDAARAAITDARASLRDEMSPTLWLDAETMLPTLYRDGRRQAALGLQEQVVSQQRQQIAGY